LAIKGIETPLSVLKLAHETKFRNLTYNNNGFNNSCHLLITEIPRDETLAGALVDATARVAPYAFKVIG
jgi:hypothetical protein